MTEELKIQITAIGFANWLAKNFWVHRGGVGDNAIWRCELPGSEWGEGETKTTPELYEIYQNYLKNEAK